MKTITIYDPPMCCASGVCGTDVDPKLVQFASDLAWLKQQGIAVQRFSLSQQPEAFVGNPLVSGSLKTHGNDCLPLVLADGEIVTRSIYPNRTQLAALAGVKEESSECCGNGGQSSCCCG